MKNIWHLFDGGSRESQALARYAMETDRRLRLFRDLSEIPYEDIEEGVMISGSVEIVQKALNRTFVPDYFPEFTKEFAGRKIWYANDLDNIHEKTFVKPADAFKRFDGFIYDPLKVYDELPVGPYELQTLVEIVKEGRYYIVHGEMICDGWYSHDPKEEESESPPLPVGLEIPKSWCGTIDVAELKSGEIIIVECHNPFGIGWYGESKEFMKYGIFLEKGWEYLKKLRKPSKINGEKIIQFYTLFCLHWVRNSVE